MKTSDLFVQCLENERCRVCFPEYRGEENLDFLESLRHSKIPTRCLPAMSKPPDLRLQR